jgi:hypothetical protein
MTVFWDVSPCSVVATVRRFVITASIIILMMEAVDASETSTNFHKTAKQ